MLSHKRFENFELIEGDICLTVPRYVADYPELKIALLHEDVDLYEPSRVILEQLFDRVVRHGLVVFDDYGTVTGERSRSMSFFNERKRSC